jgi:hypothetical protein
VNHRIWFVRDPAALIFRSDPKHIDELLLVRQQVNARDHRILRADPTEHERIKVGIRLATFPNPLIKASSNSFGNSSPRVGYL